MLSEEQKLEIIFDNMTPEEIKNSKTTNRKLYNRDKKLDFLIDLLEKKEDITSGKKKEIKKGTARNYFLSLSHAYETESKYGKDLSEMSFEELEEVLYELKSVGRNAVESYARVISRYLSWCGDNKLAHLNPKDFTKYIVGEEYISEEELKEYENDCVNAQDAIILRLLFLGVNGKESSELRNLKASDIDFERNMIMLTESGKYDKDGESIKEDETIRPLEVDDYTLNLLSQAIRQKKYQKRNGVINQTEHNNILPETDLVDNQYVIRPSITQNGSFTRPVDKFVIYRRIDTIAESLGIEALKPKYLIRSGMIYKAYQRVGNGEVTLDDIKIISKKFQVKSYHNLKSFITTENIRKTYGNV